MAKHIDVNLASFRQEPAQKASARIIVSQDNLIQLTGALDNDRLCTVETLAIADGEPVRRKAVLWASPEPLKKSVARVSKAFCEAAGLNTNDKCRIIVDDRGLPDAREVDAEDITNRDGLVLLAPSTQENDLFAWTTILEDQLDLAEVVYPGMVLKDVYHRRTKRTFRIKTVDGRTDSVARFVVDQTSIHFIDAAQVDAGLPSPSPSPALPQPLPQTPKTPKTPKATLTTTLPLRTAAGANASPAASPSRRLQARTAPSSPAVKAAASKQPQTAVAAAPAAAPAAVPPPPPPPPPQPLVLGPIEGLDSVVEEINEGLTIFDPSIGYSRTELTCALVLQGDSGTGKTMILDRIAATGWGNVYPIRPNDKLTIIQETFQKAYEQRPSIITIDNLQKLLVEERNNRTAVIQCLCDFLDSIVCKSPAIDSAGVSHDEQSAQTPQVPQVVVLVTCLDYLKDVPEDLREPQRLSNVVELPFPEPAGRRAILRSFNMPLPPDRAESMIKELSHQTHAFNGHDLRKLTAKAMRLRGRKMAVARQKHKIMNGETNVDDVPPHLDAPFYLTEDDFRDARSSVGPSRMDGIDVKPRPVYWRDIHGQEELVQALKERVDMMNNPEKYRPFIKPFPRGFLLYGPPGCSKTMAAQALATESELNYFSVKGGELLNQYVGETERSVRDLFTKARRASPAVIFLDEIDALGGRRSDFGDSSASSGRGPQMVPALLSELDGFEPLDKVLVIAATNRPEALDPALLRTGRFDNHFYVPPPNETARRAIFESWTKGMRVSTDLDLDRLARESEQLSGAEILGICQKAGRSANRALLAQTGSDCITTESFLTEIQRTPKTITPAMLGHFEHWSPSYK
ncbi:AAA+-type ATPase [Sporothrix curviconia]|uniref:AAA+-type ATPase n=1 Tax=Sporothrix curviconia TaxID=1260050 RepID=A0ABP0C9B6_9PEZI